MNEGGAKLVRGAVHRGSWRCLWERRTLKGRAAKSLVHARCLVQAAFRP